MRRQAFDKPIGYVVLVHEDNAIELVEVDHQRTTPKGRISYYRSFDGREFDTKWYSIHADPLLAALHAATDWMLKHRLLAFAGHRIRRLSKKAHAAIREQLGSLILEMAS